MTTGPIFLRAQLIYALVLPLALVMGYLLADPYDTSTVGMVSVVLGVMLIPLVLKWHHQFLFLCWNLPAMAFFIPGSPELWMVVAVLSLGVSMVQRTVMGEMRFIHAPSILLPIAFFMLVIAVTGQFTGGIGLRVLGGSTVGGKNYLYYFLATAGFLGMLAFRIPKQQTRRYLGLFFLSRAVNLISVLAPVMPPALFFLFAFFPVTGNDLGMVENGFNYGVSRFSGLGQTGLAIATYLLAIWGLENFLNLDKPWRVVLFAGLVLVIGMGGFRSTIILFGLTVLVLFWLEGLFRSRYLWMAIGTFILGGALLVPLANKLPLSVQRSLAFLPLQLDQVAVTEAQLSTEWRLNLWRMAMDEVPQYFWFGQGMAMAAQDLSSTTAAQARGGSFASDESFLLTQNFHNGPLSVVIPLGIWGVIGFVWFLIASIKALHRNYKYGDEDLKKVNAFLLASFVAKALFFLTIFGDLRADYPIFLGFVGMSLCLNHGICLPALAPVQAPVQFKSREPAGFSSKQPGLA
jgi:hypothetical protein